MPKLNFLDTYTLMAINEEVVSTPTFFADRYFPTGAGDIFASDKVLTEYRKGDRKMAAFVAPRVGDIAVGRRGYEIHEYMPAFIAPSRSLTADELNKRGFGEALYSNDTAEQRAIRLLIEDQQDLENRIRRREEWMAVQTMINNACTMQEYVDANTVGEVHTIKFYDTVSDHVYVVANPWNSGTDEKGKQNYSFIDSDVTAMCRMLSRRGLKAADLIVGTDVAAAITSNDRILTLLDKNSGVLTGEIQKELTKYDGVVLIGTINFGGFRLNIISADETYEDDNGVTQSYFPATSAMVTAPGCGRFMYGQITQMDFGSVDFTTHVARRVPKFVADQNTEFRKIRLATRPLAAPNNYCPYIYAANVVS